MFAIDGAGNVTRQVTSARALDSLPPDPVTGFRGTVGPTNVHLTWDPASRQGKNADLAGYRLMKLGAGITKPTNPRDGTEVCPGLSFRDNDCFVQNLTTGQKVTFAIYARGRRSELLGAGAGHHHAQLERPQEAAACRRRCASSGSGAKITMTWVSPKDRDLSKFRVTLYNNGPASRPSKGKAVVTGRVLHASFTLKAGQVVYVNLFAIDLSGNWSRVTRLIVMPDKLFASKSKHKKVVKKKANGSKTGAQEAQEELSRPYPRAASSTIQTTSPSSGATIAAGAGSPVRMRARASRLRSPSAMISTRRERASAGSVSVMRSYGG